MVQIKRVYDQPSTEDGFRILVDRLWPRGLTKEAAQVDLWLREIAPSSELRTWFGHDPGKWEEFRRRYFQELIQQGEAVAQICLAQKTAQVTLVYGAKDEAHNNAVALREYLEGRD